MIPLNLYAEEFDHDVRIRVAQLLEGELDFEELLEEEAPELDCAPVLILEPE
jgi:hypothetical protein